MRNSSQLGNFWQAIGVTLPGSMEQYVTLPEKSVFSTEDFPF